MKEASERCRWLSVASQVGLFEEMKHFHVSDPNVGAGAYVTPPNARVARWLNIYDPADPLAYLVAPVFRTVDQDISYSNGAGGTNAHSAYVRFRASSAPTGLDVLMTNDPSKLVLDYLHNGALAEADSAAGSALLNARETLFFSNRCDPLAAALGAYLMLRHGVLDDPTQDSISNLNALAPHLPDALCLHAEVLARRREHEKALDALLGLNGVGLPFFSDGLTIASARLAYYLRGSREDSLKLNPDRQAAARLLLTRLNWLGAHRVFGEPVLILQGFDPLDPEDRNEFQSLQPDTDGNLLA